MKKYPINILFSLATVALFLTSPFTCEIITLKLKGSSKLGYYTVDVQIGSPPQLQSLILDTGSDQMIIPCAGCEYCNKHTNSLFDPNQSSTFKQIDDFSQFLDWNCTNMNNGLCRFYQGYSEGSYYSGFYAQDLV